MRKIRMLLTAALIGAPLATVAAAPAVACPDGGCGRCHVNAPFVVDGDVIRPSGRPLVECYY